MYDRANEMLCVTSCVLERYVVCCPLSDLQMRIYKKLLSTSAVSVYLSGAAGPGGPQQLVCISNLKKLCNSPALLRLNTRLEDGNGQADSSLMLAAVQDMLPPAPNAGVYVY